MRLITLLLIFTLCILCVGCNRNNKPDESITKEETSATIFFTDIKISENQIEEIFLNRNSDEIESIIVIL